ncbi:MAG: hypothetical protein LBD14_02965 [Puniceicoccales bacterium]|jgi:hypothetical protein|nr:hypothetical protein [Puniceicoccales bacterium]
METHTQDLLSPCFNGFLARLTHRQPLGATLAKHFREHFLHRNGELSERGFPNQNSLFRIRRAISVPNNIVTIRP